MDENESIEKKFRESCFTLSEEDIRKFDQEDNGPINNVMANISAECYGCRLYDDSHGLDVKMFYIAKPDRLKGDIICLKVNDPDYFLLLFKFCHLLAVDYKEVDAIDAFNTFQSKMRGFLEKLGFFTVSSLELKQFEGKSVTMMGFSKRGPIKVKFIDKVEFYRDYFDNTYKLDASPGKEYVYLMINTDSSLIKIGYSIKPGYREKTLHSQEPTVHLIALWEASKQREKELHLKYKEKRVRGEWFRLNMSDLYELEEFMK
jgi:hypothetical protein